ncbi:MAG: M23 family metallopeptidase [Peptococcaceae bacterium]|jgi:murein DD-endopeptidase MepM/ murein hydrolase activator NlpD|nr:M23 family metallopeptidase [Peptococcaceae bacterium]
MATGRHGRVAEKPASAKPKRKKIILRGRRLWVIRLLLLALILGGIFVLTFLFSALVTGRIGQVAQVVRGFATPGTPKLVIGDMQHEYRISPLSQKNTQEFRFFLNTNYEDNQGIVTLRSEGSAVADYQSQTPFQKQLTKLGYSPQSLTIKQYASQIVAFSAEPTYMETYIFFQNEYFYSNSLEEINRFLPDSDGLCYVLVSAVWEPKNVWQVTRSGMYCFAILYDRPAEFSVNSEDLDPGELLVFYAEYLMPGEAVSIQGNLPAGIQFFPYGSRQMIALSPIQYDVKPGTYTTTLTAGGVSKTFDITVKWKEFATQYATIDPQIVADTRTDATDQEFRDKINPILSEKLPELLWQGRASLPVPESKVLTLFGSHRYINDDVLPNRHKGLDLQAPTGTEVRAINNGRVLFAEYLAYTGNTILIEHGLGLKSLYYHLDEILVVPGDNVAKDDVIGLSGETGFVAEPHLHLGLVVGEIYINPVTAINQPLFNEPLR